MSMESAGPRPRAAELLTRGWWSLCPSLPSDGPFGRRGRAPAGCADSQGWRPKGCDLVAQSEVVSRGVRPLAQGSWCWVRRGTPGSRPCGSWWRAGHNRPLPGGPRSGPRSCPRTRRPVRPVPPTSSTDDPVESGCPLMALSHPLPPIAVTRLPAPDPTSRGVIHGTRPKVTNSPPWRGRERRWGGRSRESGSGL